MHALLHIVRAPLDDYMAALNACLTRVSVAAVLAIVGGFLVSYWVYVPIHELLHVVGCVATGGEVTRLEMSPTYGAAALQKIFPFIAVGSDYAGQLTGFDTHGNDLTYLATDFTPFLLTILIGIPALRLVGTRPMRPLRACVLLGVSLPVAFAPFISITGDYYEMGSIIVSRAVAWSVPSFPLARWRSDDLFKLGTTLFFSDAPFAASDVAGVSASFVGGVMLIFATYWAGMQSARILGVRRSD